MNKLPRKLRLVHYERVYFFDKYLKYSYLEGSSLKEVIIWVGYQTENAEQKDVLVEQLHQVFIV